jgi:hypothetical protein
MTQRGPLNPVPVPKSNNRTIPKFFSEQNAVLLNDIYSIEPGETIEFDVYIKQIEKNTMTNLADLLTVKVSSESNPSNHTSLSVNGVKSKHEHNFDFDFSGCSAMGFGTITFAAFAIAVLVINRKKR